MSLRSQARFLADVGLGLSAAWAVWAATRAPDAGETLAGVPVIDRVSLEKSAICVGEDNLVTVSAHALPLNAPLEVRIERQSTHQLLVRAGEGDRGRRKRIGVAVFAAKGKSAATIAEFQVKDCTAQSSVRLNAQPSNTWDGEVTFALESLAPQRASDGGAAAGYAWSFGDGQAATTSAPHVVHSYARRAQTSATSDYLVSVAYSAEQPTARARATISLRNEAFASAMRDGLSTVHVAREPHTEPSPALPAVWLWHDLAQPVVLDTVVASGTLTDGERLEPRAIPVTSLLDPPIIPPGSGVRWAAWLPDDLSALEYRFAGHTATGEAAVGHFTLDRSEPSP